MRAEGAPSGVAVASATASGSSIPVSRASANQAWNIRSGSGSASRSSRGRIKRRARARPAWHRRVASAPLDRARHPPGVEAHPAERPLTLAQSDTAVVGKQHVGAVEARSRPAAAGAVARQRGHPAERVQAQRRIAAAPARPDGVAALEHRRIDADSLQGGGACEPGNSRAADDRLGHGPILTSRRRAGRGSRHGP